MTSVRYLVEMKPLFGSMLSHYLKPYSHWSYTDPDILWGNDDNDDNDDDCDDSVDERFDDDDNNSDDDGDDDDSDDYVIIHDVK